MGYRVRLGRVIKLEAESFRDLSENELDEMDQVYYRPEFHDELVEIGKGYSMPEHRTPFYTKFELEEEEFDILSKEGLAAIIEDFRNDIETYYTEIEEEEKDFHFSWRQSQWKKGTLGPKFPNEPLAYYLRDGDQSTDGFITGSWVKEYAIFNLIYLYRTFDFENDYLIYSGW